MPIVLVGTKIDLRDPKLNPDAAKMTFISFDKAEELRQELGMYHCIECSALTQRNLKKVFDTAIR